MELGCITAPPPAYVHGCRLPILTSQWIFQTRRLSASFKPKEGGKICPFSDMGLSFTTERVAYHTKKDSINHILWYMVKGFSPYASLSNCFSLQEKQSFSRRWRDLCWHYIVGHFSMCNYAPLSMYIMQCWDSVSLLVQDGQVVRFAKRASTLKNGHPHYLIPHR